MLFSSSVFLFLFLPIVLSVYFLVRGELRNLWLLLASIIFYMWGEALLVVILFASIGINYLAGLMIAGGFRSGPVETLTPGEPRSLKQKICLAVSIAANLALLGFFKYFNFGVDSFNALMTNIGLDDARWTSTWQITLPLGISFFTFQSLSYTIDVYLGHTRATKNLLHFATFVTLFPQLVAGPIVRYQQIAAELVKRTIGLDGMAEGVRRFVVGLGKKMIIANTVAWPADQIFALPDSEITTSLAWFATLCYTLQIYFDFSGYSDMAIGLGLLFGFHFPENFNYPYIAKSVQDFWRRWHISLSTWFRDYLYFPLGGNRHGSLRTYRNLLIVFFLCGLWHGASWTFVAWGLFHGIFLSLERTAFGSWIGRQWAPLRHGYTLIVAMVGWVIFRSDTFSQSITFLTAMAGFAPAATAANSVLHYCTTELLLVLAFGLLGSTPWLSRLQSAIAASGERLNAAVARPIELLHRTCELAFLGVIFIYSSMLLGAQTHNPFIYFRF